MGVTTEELQSQWSNPGDIFSLLLLIGSDIVQKAIAQLVGRTVRLPGTRSSSLSVALVAFSFGWAAYGFASLLATFGEMKLMPASDCLSVLVNCASGFSGETRSWALGRLLRDYEIRCGVDPRPIEDGGRAESIRIDVFNLGPATRLSCDFVWWLGWAILLVQVGIAVLPWVLYDDWGIMLITLCGNLLVVITYATPQWTQEKRAGQKLKRDKVTCLTRGNGHLRIMVFIGVPGSWDLEHLSTGISIPRLEANCISLALAILWTCVLISISGLGGHTWFLVRIGGVRMLQNLVAAGIPREPGASNFHINKFSRAPTIIGRSETYMDDTDANLEDALNELEYFYLGIRKAAVKPLKSRYHSDESLLNAEMAGFDF